jgi:hypothetical protein
MTSSHRSLRTLACAGFFIAGPLACGDTASTNVQNTGSGGTGAAAAGGAPGGTSGSSAAGTSGTSAGGAGTAGEASGSGSGGTSTDAGTDAAGASGSAATGGSGGSTVVYKRCVPTMPQTVSIGGVTDREFVSLGDFCMMNREVVRGEYAEFVEYAKTNTIEQAPECAGNTTFRVDEGYGTETCTVETGASYPQVCVDTCDAAAYCKWIGGRLCGRRGGGRLAPAEVPTLASEWTYACSNGGATRHPSTAPNGGYTKECSLSPGDDVYDLPYRNTNYDRKVCGSTIAPFSRIQNLMAGVLEMTNNLDGGYWLTQGTWEGLAGPSARDCFSSPNRVLVHGQRSGSDSDTGFRCCADTVTF